MGCISAIITRIGSGIKAVFTRDGAHIAASYTPVAESPSVLFTRQGGANVAFARHGGVKARFGLVCGTNLGEGYLYASDALLITIENGKLIVKDE